MGEEATMNQDLRRISYFALCALPFLALAVCAARPLRSPGVYQVIGFVLFAAIVIAAWSVGARVIGVKDAEARKFALAGTLLILPWAVISLLWVGIGAPFQATLQENYMRCLVLVSSSILVTSAFVVLKDGLYDGGERFYSTIAFATALIAGATYLTCLSISLAHIVMTLRGDETPAPAILGYLYSTLEFVACIMTYVTTALFATAMRRTRFLGRGAAFAYATASAILILLLVMRGLLFPEISANTAPWYTRPGVIAGIPAIPWIMPCLLGAVLLRRAGDVES
jgi:hypothetical protein